MTNNTLKVLKAYLLLSAQEKLGFLSQITEIEQMNGARKMDYTESLLLRKSNENETARA